MRLIRTLFLPLLVGAVLSLPAAEAPAPPLAVRAVVGPMKTSIYVGNVTLTTSEFLRDGDAFSATYEAKVWPWFFWSESGKITITLKEADNIALRRTETREFTGEAFNQKNKPRKVTGRAQPADANSGKIKVRITVDDVELIFNGTYLLGDAQPANPPTNGK
jgi:xanthosine utilization system XapX-like protein